MKSLFLVLLVVSVPLPLCLAICDLPGPIDRPPSGPPSTGTPDGPGEPTSNPDPTPGGSRAPGRPGGITGRTASPRAAISYAAAWSLWWELNGEHLRGLRKTLPSRDAVTEGGGDAREAARSRALPILRRIAIGNGPKSVRAAGETSAMLLETETTPVHTRRSAVIGLSLLLRDPPAGEELRATAEEALLRTFTRSRDPLIQGFAAMGMGTARVPFGIPALVKAVDKTGPAAVRLFTGSRSNALEALGLLGDGSPEVMEVLLTALPSDSPVVVQSAAVALGFLGDRRTVAVLVKKLAKAPWEAVRMHMVVGILLDRRDRDPLFEIDACCNPYALTDATRELVRIY